MKKTIFALLLAGLLLVSATACSSCGDTESGSGTETETRETGKDPLSTGDPSDTNEETEPDVNIDENEADFTDVSKEIYVFAAQANIRSTPAVLAGNKNHVTTAYQGDILNVTGEGTNWYRIELEDQDKPCYISKSVVGDKSVLDAFADGDPETVVMCGVNKNNKDERVNFRSFPSSDSEYSICGQLAEGDIVTRVAESDGWSKILYQAKGDEEPKPYFVRSSYLAPMEETTGTETETNGTETETNA